MKLDFFFLGVGRVRQCGSWPLSVPKLPRFILEETMQHVPLKRPPGISLAATLSRGFADVRALLQACLKSFQEKVLDKASWLIPAQVLTAMDICFDLPSFLAGPGPSPGDARVEAFMTVASYVRQRWPWQMPSCTDRALRRQYKNLFSSWWSQGRDRPEIFKWSALWRAVHADADFFVPDTSGAFFVFHACGSIQSSEARCEGLASQLKRMMRSGCRPGRAVEKVILKQQEAAMGEAFLLRVWAEVSKRISFRCKRPRRREKAFPLGKGSKTLHTLLGRQERPWSFAKIRSLPRVGPKVSSARAWERLASKRHRQYG